MSASLETYNRILFLDLRPWLLSGVSELKFKQDLNDLKKEGLFIGEPDNVAELFKDKK